MSASLAKLQQLAIVSKVCQELENFLGVGDKVLAEFIISIAETCATAHAFAEKLSEMADLPHNFVENLYSTIQRMKPSKQEAKPENDAASQQDKTLAQQFPALSMPNKQTIKEEVKKESKKRKRSKSLSDDEGGDRRSSKRRRESDTGKTTDTIHVGETYRATIRGLQPYGVFAQLEKSYKGDRIGAKKEGLCHVSAFEQGMDINKMRKGDDIYVRVVGIDEKGKISLSAKDVSQINGKDLSDKAVPVKSSKHHPKQSISGIPLSAAHESAEPSRPKKKLSEHELWELRQLRASGVIQAHEDPLLDEHLLNNQDIEEHAEIALSQKEAPFLKGQTVKAGVKYEPVPVSKNPEGSLTRAADMQSSLSRDRKEMREQQKSALANAVPQEALVNRNFGDSVDDGKDEFRALPDAQQMPEWRQKSMGTTMGKSSKLSIREQREALPVFKLKNEIIDAVNKNQVLVLLGETGSGKTTQLTQYLAEAGYTSKGMIGCTQPRRVAAISVAKRVAEEFGCKIGQEVGYTIRFEDCTGPDTKIKYMTDGMLLREALADPEVTKYSVIMLDEAHERNLHTDVLFGLLKGLLQKRKDLKVIVTSATLNAEKFSTYFGGCGIFKIPGRNFPVEIMYTKEPQSDYLDAALVTVMQIHLTEPPGDILLFLTGQEEIESACQILFDRMKQMGKDVPELLILPVYSALPSEMQSKIFEPAPAGSRKVVIGTNIAETSITIDGIYYVVDPGFVKQNCYDPKSGMDRLIVVPISQAASTQRAGRAGRTGPGKCYRLYTEEAYNSEMLPNSIPEIQRTNLGNTVLMLKAMGINDLLNFDFMDPPPPQAMVAAMEELYHLGALDDEGLLTKLGRRMAEFPVEPQMSKALIASVDLGCSDELLTIIAMLSVQTVFYRPREKQQLADQKKSKFFQPEGDHLTLLAVFQAWKNTSYSTQWCFDNFIQNRSLKRAMDIRKQLVQLMDRFKLDIVSCGKNFTLVRKAITSGYFANAGKKDQQEGYKTLVDQQPIYMHPGSSMFNTQPEYVVYHTIVQTTKEYMREVTAIDPKWLYELAPKFYTKADAATIAKQRKGDKIVPLANKFEDDKSWRISKRRR